ncbi:MAG TPA: PIN domain-containing protein, partial [Ktedonobacterales bacterium]|nr:PIN domain-containing protein [Ktedonobacterales bacterium]
MTRPWLDGLMRIRWRNMVADWPTSEPLRVLLDTHVVLDRILQRQPWFDQAADLWRARSTGLLVAYLAASTLTDIFYIGRRIVGSADALAGVDVCLREFGIVAVTREVLLAARALSGPDFEDNVQMACAQATGLQLIVTRDVAGFA